ncbi:AarF/ABC1/UbiB kinase family protein [Candidatus Roizmanbacteria bacterium]|nr:AarF/ABC1/UbiB kinase family protein [Candidatus Roizmanbacteria bacterium]
MFRVIYLIFLLSKYFSLYLLTKIGLSQFPRHKLIKKFFEEAGGAFVKFGQILALRVDVLSKNFSLELFDLFDNYKPFPFEEVKRIFQEELGVFPEKIFKHFEKEPFASASFAQVHGAKLKNGETVVVKVQRPDVLGKIAVDFLLIDLLSVIADLFFKIEALPWREFAKEFKIWTRKELDYQTEAENMDKIYNNLLINKITDVVIPKIYHRISTKKILVQDYIDGVPLSRALKEIRKGNLDAEKLKKMNIDIKKTPVTLTLEILREYFIDGFFHADPHPGNILLLKDGKIGLIDFGIVGESAPRRQAFMRFLLAGAKSKYEKSQKIYEEFAFYAFQFSGEKIEQIISSALPASLEQNKIEKFMKILTIHFLEYFKRVETKIREDLAVMKIDYTAMILQMLKFVARYQIKLPKQMVIFIRALSIIGFLAKEMDIEFNASQALVKFFQKYPEERLPKIDSSATPYKRLGREEAIDRLNNWLAYLIEIDPKLYHLVSNYISKYNI